MADMLEQASKKKSRIQSFCEYQSKTRGSCQPCSTYSKCTKNRLDNWRQWTRSCTLEVHPTPTAPKADEARRDIVKATVVYSCKEEPPDPSSLEFQWFSYLDEYRPLDAWTLP